MDEFKETDLSTVDKLEFIKKKVNGLSRYGKDSLEEFVKMLNESREILKPMSNLHNYENAEDVQEHVKKIGTFIDKRYNYWEEDPLVTTKGFGDFALDSYDDLYLDYSGLSSLEELFSPIYGVDRFHIEVDSIPNYEENINKDKAT